MNAKLILITIFLLFQNLFSQQEIIYFGKDWKVTTKENASFYRKMPLKESGEIILVKDYYIDGTRQFEGYALKKNNDDYVGDIIWYDEEGNDDNFTQYKNYSSVQELTYYHENGHPRKIISFKNGMKDEVKIFDFEGKVLTNGFYKDGKPNKGDFETLETNYSTNRTYREKEEGKAVQLIPQPTITSTKIPQQKKLPGKDDRQLITQKIFWSKSNKIAQEKVFVVNKYGYSQIGQKNYDAKGKLIQNKREEDFGEYDYRLLNGIDFQYYLQNNFAVSLKSETTFVKGVKTGTNKVYFVDGPLLSETNYVRGSKEGEENIFDKAGNIINKRNYRDGKPFTGNFDEAIGELYINLNYINGKKEGKAIAKNEDEKIIAQGDYKDGRPFNGTFIVEDRNGTDREFINVKNFKRNGLQTLFNYRITDIIRTYTLKDDLLDGPTTYYLKGKPVSILEYKNDLPYEGTRTYEKKEMVYKNRQLLTETIYTDQSHQSIYTQKIYINGTIHKIIDASFEIPSVNEGAYIGIFKNGEPFSGYFQTDDSEYKQINYLENGQLKFQYSNDRMSNMDNYMHESYNIKSTFKDGKIFEGVEYIKGGRQMVARYFSNGILKSFDWDLYAMNYFNRIHFELKNNIIEMFDYQEELKANISLDYSKGNFTTKLLTEKFVIDHRTITADDQFKGNYFQKIKIYTITKDKIKSKNIYVLTEEHENYGASKFFYRAYAYLDYDSKTAQETFVNLSKKIAGEPEDEDEGEDEKDKYNSEITTGAILDKAGKPVDGIIITNLSNKTFQLDLYSEGELIKTLSKINFEQMKSAIDTMETLNK